jgi:hypothetical protein
MWGREKREDRQKPNTTVQGKSIVEVIKELEIGRGYVNW